MVAQNCPRCSSSRIRRGYRPTPIWAKVLFRYNLLCDSCNWEFRGFAIPGTVTTKPPKKRKKGNSAASAKEDNLKSNDGEISDQINDKPESIKKDAKTDHVSDSVENNKNKPNKKSSNQKNEKRVRIKL